MIAQEIRRDVFIKEQGIPEQIELDGLDEKCRHIIVFYNYAPAGCCRLRMVDGSIKVERFAVLREHRSLGLGTALMEYVLSYAKQEGYDDVWLNAQLPVKGYYEKLGFTAVDGIFEEAGIEHVRMVYAGETNV